MQVAQQRPAQPSAPLTAFPPRLYVKSANTDVQATWRAHGWLPTDPNYHATVRVMLNRLS